jgi:hypothetical protein
MRKILARTALIAGVAAVAIGAAVAFADDTVFPDGDTGVASPNLAYGSGSFHACADRGTPVAGAVTVNYNGNGTTDPTKHFSPGEALNVQFTPTSGSGVTVTPGTIPNVPSTWGSSPSDHFTVPFTTTVPATLATNASVEVSVTGQSSGYSAGDGSGTPGKPKFNVIVNCDGSSVTNATPSVAFSSPPTQATEGDVKTFNFTITDSDADTWSYAAGYPDCGSLGSISGTSLIDQTTKTGTFSCSFPDGLVPASASTVSVQVSDGHALSNAATTSVTVNNANPVVGTLTLGGNSALACVGGNTVTLDFGFSDAGVNDNPWGADIDWGDGSTHTTYNAGAQGTQSQQSHLYSAGTWTAGAQVTDKDGGYGSGSTAAGAVSLLYSTGIGILQPINYTGPRSSFKSGSTIPVKIKITDCSGAPVSTLHPQVSLKYLDGSPDGTSVEDFYSTVPDQGTTMRFTGAPDYQYIYNLGTKGRASGDYTVTVSDPTIAPVSASFSVKK